MPTFVPGKIFSLSGSNLNLTERVMFGKEEVSPLAYLGSTGVSGLVPVNAYTNEVFITTNTDVLNLGKFQVVLDSASQVVASGLLPYNVSGKAGGSIALSGENFHQITNVKFGNTDASFTVFGEDEIGVLVPENADYSKLTVFSSLRTGLNGSITQASGLTNNEFVPIPEVNSLSSGQLVSGETLTISGTSFSGVTGVTINDIELESFEVNSATDLQGVIPSGNVRGVPNLLLQSGVSQSAPSILSFKPLAEITGIQPDRELGQIVKISGKNFSSGILYSGLEYDRYLVSVGGITGNFKLLNETSLTGILPTGLAISVSGDVANVGAGSFKVSSHPVFIYSDTYPEQYPSEFEITPAIGAPTINSVTPLSGIGGDAITIEGTNLYGITGVNFGSVGIGSDSTNLSPVTPGKSATFIIPSLSYDNTGAYLEISLSGYFGSVGPGPAAVNVLGKPVINSIYPNTDVLPGSTGTVYGSNLYSGTVLTLHDNSINPNFFISDLEVSGYVSDHSEVIFNYPNSFETGITYKLFARNRRTRSALNTITTKNSPVFSGFTPLSGEYGSTVTVSGYFETISPNGLSVGNVVVDEYTQSSTTGIAFQIPQNALSDLIKVETSGGLAFSTGIVGVSPSKPSISGYYYGQGEKPVSFDQGQVFGNGDFLTVTGRGMNLTTGVLFSGSDSSIEVGSFIKKTPTSLVFQVPASTNSGSGQFLLKDFQDRQTPSPYDINVTKFSGFSNCQKPGDTFSLSGENVSGLDVRFSHPTGGFLTSPTLTNSISYNVETITATVPTGIAFGPVSVSGRSNLNAAQSLYDFYPLALITGVTGFSSNVATSGNAVGITGLNAYDISNSGNTMFSVGITGTGNKNNLAEVSMFAGLTSSSGMGIGAATDLFYQTTSVDLGNSFIGTGQLFIANEWDNEWDSEGWPTTMEKLPSQISLFPDQFIIQGTRVNVTGYGPSRGVTGSNIELSGEGFNEVTGVFFEIPNGASLSSQFTINSDNKITATVPSEGIEARGMTNVILSGGTNDEPGQFEVILDASVVEFNINDESDVPTSSSRVGNFTQRETVGGDVFLVTRTRFPDGTTAVISSTPEA